MLHKRNINIIYITDQQSLPCVDFVEKISSIKGNRTIANFHSEKIIFFVNFFYHCKRCSKENVKKDDFFSLITSPPGGNWACNTKLSISVFSEEFYHLKKYNKLCGILLFHTACYIFCIS